MDALSAVVNQPQFVLSRLRQLGQASSVAGVTEKEREMLFKSVAVLGDCVSICDTLTLTLTPTPTPTPTPTLTLTLTPTLTQINTGCAAPRRPSRAALTPTLTQP